MHAKKILVNIKMIYFDIQVLNRNLIFILFRQKEFLLKAQVEIS